MDILERLERLGIPGLDADEEEALMGFLTRLESPHKTIQVAFRDLDDETSGFVIEVQIEPHVNTYELPALLDCAFAEAKVSLSPCGMDDYDLEPDKAEIIDLLLEKDGIHNLSWNSCVMCDCD